MQNLPKGKGLQNIFIPLNYSQLKDFLSNKFMQVSPKKLLERIEANNLLQAYAYGCTGWLELKIV